MFPSPFTFFGATAIYLSSHFLIHILSSSFRVPYLHSEWLCWSFLLLVANLARPGKDDDQDATAQSDKLALAIAAVCAFRTVGGVDWALVCPYTLPCCATTDPLLLIASAHALVAVRHTPSVERQSSTRVPRKGSGCPHGLLPSILCRKIGSSVLSDPCSTVRSLASTTTIFGVADMRRSRFCPCPHGRLHVDPRTKGRTVVRAGRRPDTNTLPCDIMAGLGRPDGNVPDRAQNLLANKVFRASRPGHRGHAEVSTVGDGDGTGQSSPFVPSVCLTYRTGAQRIPDATDYSIDVCHQHHTDLSSAGYSGESWTGRQRRPHQSSPDAHVHPQDIL